MTSQTQKQEIVRSLSELDALQSEKVLNYIKTLLTNHQNDMRHHRAKRQAMKEIGQALQQLQKPLTGD